MIEAPAPGLVPLDELVDAFARGNNKRGEALLFAALDDGQDWQAVTTAVALGVARRRDASADPPESAVADERRPSAGPRDGLAEQARALLSGIAAYVLAAPLLAVGHELLVLVVAGLLAGVAWLGGSGIVQTLPLDPIYTSAMLLTLGGIQTRGLAVATALGEWLNELWPAVFEPPMLVAEGAWASAVIEPGATIVSRWLSGLAADAVLLLLGLLAVQRGMRGRPWLAIAGAILQADLALKHLVDLPPKLRELEAAGIPFAVAMIVSGDVQAGPRLSEQLAAMPGPLRDTILGLAFLLVAYLPALLLLLGPPLVVRLWRRAASLAGRIVQPARPERASARRPSRSVPILARRVATAGAALAIALTPLGDLADAETRYLPTPAGELPSEEIVAEFHTRLDAGIGGVEPTPDAAEAPPTAASPTRAAAPVAPSVASGPSLVTVTGSDYRYTLTVNGEPQVVRGIGYNVRYQRLDPAERARRLDRDFARLRQMGVNTVFGWEPLEFDQLLLDTAHTHGLGVAPPFELDPAEDYTDPAVRARLTADVLAWVERYRSHPALRMWAIGNEVLHKLVYPSWMPVRSDPAWEAQARAFASFYVGLIDRVHALDPDHPILHRDAEDAYLTWLRDALSDGRKRPWFVYGVNAYTPRLAQILAAWPHQGFDVALLVSEFAPGGMSPADRPQGFRSMWRAIRAAHGWALGGSVYAWTTDGPEEVDRVFGLVDDQGKPVDNALATVAALFRGVERTEPDPATAGAERVDTRVVALAHEAIRAIQEGRGKSLLAPDARLSIMGSLSDIPREAVRDADLEIARVRDPRHVAWERETGITAEWWATWTPTGRPHQKLTFLIRERAGAGPQIAYIYHGPR